MSYGDEPWDGIVIVKMVHLGTLPHPSLAPGNHSRVEMQSIFENYSNSSFSNTTSISN